MTPALRETISTALTLLVFAVAGAALLAGAHSATRANIEKSEQIEKLALVSQTLAPGSFDNDLIRDARPLPADPLLGLKQPGSAYLARKGGAASAVVLEAVAPDGYAGDIKLLVGVKADGRISGVRVTAHKETPGLGDYIDIKKSDWIRQFDGKSAEDPAGDGWKVQKDGGEFYSMAGATISPRAVVKAVHNALLYFERHKAELLAIEPKEATK